MFTYWRPLRRTLGAYDPRQLDGRPHTCPHKACRLTFVLCLYQSNNFLSVTRNCQHAFSIGQLFKFIIRQEEHRMDISNHLLPYARHKAKNIVRGKPLPRSMRKLEKKLLKTPGADILRWCRRYRVGQDEQFSQKYFRGSVRRRKAASFCCNRTVQTTRRLMELCC